MTLSVCEGRVDTAHPALNNEPSIFLLSLVGNAPLTNFGKIKMLQLYGSEKITTRAAAAIRSRP
jgi:hypothetical protein